MQNAEKPKQCSVLKNAEHASPQLAHLISLFYTGRTGRRSLNQICSLIISSFFFFEICFVLLFRKRFD